MTMTAPTTQQLERGWRDDLGVHVHDVDTRDHRVAVDFPVVIDTYRTDFGPGAFEDGWRQQLPVMCANHRQDHVIGRAIAAESLPDCHRLIGKFSNFDDVPQAKSVFANIRDNIYPGWSFYFIGGVGAPHPSGRRDAIRIKKARMIEFGPVLAPSIPGTVVVPGSLRSALHAQHGRSNVRADLARAFARYDSNRALDVIDRLQVEGVRRSGGKLPRSVAARVHDSGTRQSELEIEQLAQFGEALLHAETNRRDLARYGL
jgi:Caudovirus prohead serine protease